MQTSFPLSGRRAAKQSGNSTRSQQQPGGNPWTERATKRKWSGKFTTSLYVVCYALSANQPENGAERGLKLFALFLMFFYFNLLSRFCQLRSFRNYPRPRPLLGRAPKKNIHVTVMLLRTLGGQRFALYHSKAYLVLGGAPHPGPKTLLPDNDLEVGGRRS